MTFTMNSIRTFGSVHRYFQGPGAVEMIGDLCAGLGKHPVLVTDSIVSNLLSLAAVASCESKGLKLPWVPVSGEVTRASVSALVRQAKALSPDVDVVVAAGGGKSVDTGKAVSRELGTRLVVVPTAASNDGPCSKAFVYYDEHHHLESVEFLSRNPDAVLVDTRLMVQAPKALLVSGIGDALCKLYEGDQVRAVNGLNLFGGLGTIASIAISKACDRVIREDSEEGLKAIEIREPTPAFERLVEALVLLSGLAFENSGLSIAHSITRGLPLVKGVDSTMHGQHVAYGLLIQMLLEKRSESFIQDQLKFYRRLGLATCLADLGAVQTDAIAIECIAKGTMTSPHIKHFNAAIDHNTIAQAMHQLEKINAS